jgi:hypothetical protein
MKRLALLAGLIVCACATDPSETADDCSGPDCWPCEGADCDLGKADGTGGYNDLNTAAGDLVMYEVQVRTANACDPTLGADWQREDCTNKIAPEVPYRAEGMTCSSIDDLKRIRLGTLDDMLENTDDYRSGITLRYIDEKVGANAVWLMPLFPNNDTWAIPDACDDLGSPYAVRDYLHVQGSLSRDCIAEGRDEHSATPCWGDAELDAFIADAHARGMKVFLDLAFNHFGHNYLMYDYADYTTIGERIAAGQDLEKLSTYSKTYEKALLTPEIVDTEAKLTALAKRSSKAKKQLKALDAKCPGLSGDARVRAFHMWRNALDWEKATFDCANLYLEFDEPGFYVGADHWSPSQHAGDNFSGDGYNTWNDVKFLYHQKDNTAHRHEYVRNREYLFRVMNYWVARGVDGFRLDHTTDAFSGISADEWKYVISKVDYYAYKRGQARPVFLSEEFHDQQAMSRVSDIMIEGYVRDMTGRDGVTKDAGHVEAVIGGMGRFNGHTFVLSALETHDEMRLTAQTGFSVWTGAGFWGIGATTWSTPMIVMGQEFGEGGRLEFRKSALLRSRFAGAVRNDLVDFYRSMVAGRLASENRALRSANYRFLRTRDGNAIDPRIYAAARWSGDGNVVFVFHNLWEQSVAQSYYLPPDLASALSIRDATSYRLVDVMSGQQQGSCLTGADLKWTFYVQMSAATRMQWLRLETCN